MTFIRDFRRSLNGFFCNGIRMIHLHRELTKHSINNLNFKNYGN